MKKIILWLLKTNTKPSKKSIDNEKKKKNKYCNVNFSSQPTNPGYIFSPYSSRTSFDIYEWHFDKAKSMNENFFLNSIAVNPTKNTWPKTLKQLAKVRNSTMGRMALVQISKSNIIIIIIIASKLLFSSFLLVWHTKRYKL